MMDPGKGLGTRCIRTALYEQLLRYQEPTWDP
jgi:hypothetical protein